MLAIFDLSSVNVCRYNSELLKSQSSQYIAYVDDPDLCEPIADINCRLFCTGWWKISRFISHFRENDVSVVVISGQRSADLRVLVAANALSIPIIYKMHGLYLPYMKREASFFVTKFVKSLRTLFYLVDVGFFTRNFSIPLGMLGSVLFGRTRKSWAGAEELRFDVGLIWSEYWESWHSEHWVMVPRDGWLLIGNPDTIKFNKIEVEESSLVYIYQTLVEDGRITAKLMNEFYDRLESAARKSRRIVHVKCHPRGDNKIFDTLIERGFIIHNDFPKGDLYVGHYSSLLGVVPLMGAQVIVVDLEGHSIPESIRQIASNVVENFDNLALAIENYAPSHIPKKAEAIYYFGDQYAKNIEMVAINKFLKIGNAENR